MNTTFNPRPLTAVESFSVTEKLTQKMSEWNNSSTHSRLGMLGARVVGTVVVPFAALVDFFIHLGLTIVKGIGAPLALPFKYIPVKPFSYLKTDDMELSSPINHFEQTYKSLFRIIYLSIACAISPDHAYTMTTNTASRTIANMNGQLTAQATELNRVCGQLQQMTTERDGLVTKKRDLEGNLVILESEKAANVQEISQLRSQLEPKNEQIRSLIEKTNQLAQNIAEKNAKINEYDAKLAQKTGQNDDDCQSKREELKKQIAKLESDKNANDQEIANLRAEISEKDQLITDLNGKVADLHQQMKDNDRDVKDKNREIAEKNEEINGLKKSVEAWQQAWLQKGTQNTSVAPSNEASSSSVISSVEETENNLEASYIKVVDQLLKSVADSVNNEASSSDAPPPPPPPAPKDLMRAIQPPPAPPVPKPKTTQTSSAHDATMKQLLAGQAALKPGAPRTSVIEKPAPTGLDALKMQIETGGFALKKVDMTIKPKHMEEIQNLINCKLYGKLGQLKRYIKDIIDFYEGNLEDLTSSNAYAAGLKNIRKENPELLNETIKYFKCLQNYFNQVTKDIAQEIENNSKKAKSLLDSDNWDTAVTDDDDYVPPQVLLKNATNLFRNK